MAEKKPAAKKTATKPAPKVKRINTDPIVDRVNLAIEKSEIDVYTALTEVLLNMQEFNKNT